jgi:hypothetical protein
MMARGEGLAVKRILIGLSFLWLASLACTLTSSPEAENDTLSTPTPARISVAQTETAAATPLAVSYTHLRAHET